MGYSGNNGAWLMENLYYGTDGNGSTKYAFLQTHSAQTKLYTLVNTPLLFGTNSTERMRIDSSGNVGIGTSQPAGEMT